jgi:hypothetical protein
VSARDGDTVKDFFDRLWRRIQDAFRAGRRTAQALIVGAALASLASLSSCADARAVTIVNAGRLDQVRLGFALGLDGTVSSGCTAGTFALRDPVHLSMKVSNGTVGSVVRVAVRDTETYRVAWSEERAVPPGVSYVTFDVGRGLARGRYRTESTLGGTSASPREFVIR